MNEKNIAKEALKELTGLLGELQDILNKKAEPEAETMPEGECETGCGVNPVLSEKYWRCVLLCLAETAKDAAKDSELSGYKGLVASKALEALVEVHQAVLKASGLPASASPMRVQVVGVDDES